MNGDLLEIDIPEITTTGNITADGDITARGDVLAEGDINALGEITTQQGGGISFSTHTHGGVDTGNGNTGTPN